MLRLSAVMPVRDRPTLALNALSHLLHQEESLDEIVIVDDGSKIPFEDQLGEMLGVAKSKGIALKIVRNDHPTGVSAARNLGVLESKGDVICFCDSDDYWRSDKTKHIKGFLLDPKISVLFHAFNWDGGTLRIFGCFPKLKLLKLPRSLMIAFSFLNPSCFSIRRVAYGTGFNKDMRHHEDLEYFLRLSKSHSIWLFNDALTFMSRPPGTAGGASEDQIRMRRGAIVALESAIDGPVYGSIALAKISYHAVRLWIERELIHSSK